MADMARARRLADRIRVIVAEALEKRVKDPRLGFVTITDVRVTGDLRDATVFYTVYGTDQEWQQTADALASVTGLLRTEVGRGTGVKFTPTLSFQPDAIPDAARSITELLERAKVADAQVSQLAAGSTFAGDADPYRHPEDDAGEDDAGEDVDNDANAVDADEVASHDGDADADQRT
jgi:ribosome-binding factor A